MSDASSVCCLLARQHVGQLSLTLGRSKVVGQGIQKAVHTSNAQEHQIESIGAIWGLLVLLKPLVKHQVVSQKETVGGHEAQHKYHQDCKRHHHCSSSSAGTSWDSRWHSAQGADNLGVRHHRDKQGQENQGAGEGDEVVFQPENVP